MNKFFIIIFSICILFYSCKSDSEDAAADCQSGQITATIDGEPWEAISLNSTIVHAVEGEVSMKRIDLRGTASDGTMLIVSFTNFAELAEGNCVETKFYPAQVEDGSCKYEGDIAYSCEAMLGNYYESTSDSFGLGTWYEGPGGVTVTSCSEGTVSGSFEFIVSDLKETEWEVEGTFENICLRETNYPG